MLERTKTHHTRDKELSELAVEEQDSSAEFHIKAAYGELPRWAIALAGLRYREGLTQKQLGGKIDVKQSNISLMERGLRPMGKNIAQRLARMFGVDYRVFL